MEVWILDLTCTLRSQSFSLFSFFVGFYSLFGSNKIDQWHIQWHSQPYKQFLWNACWPYELSPFFLAQTLYFKLLRQKKISREYTITQPPRNFNGTCYCHKQCLLFHLFDKKNTKEKVYWENFFEKPWDHRIRQPSPLQFTAVLINSMPSSVSAITISLALKLSNTAYSLLFLFSLFWIFVIEVEQTIKWQHNQSLSIPEKPLGSSGYIWGSLSLQIL